MANWKIIIYASTLWSRKDELTPKAFTSEFVAKLKEVQPKVKKLLGEDADSVLQDIIDDFEMSIDDESTYDDVDYVLQDFYNWADFNYVWLETMSQKAST